MLPTTDRDPQDDLHVLETGPSHLFADWPNPSVPKVTAGVYTIWRHDRLVYVGMSGRGLVPERLESAGKPAKAKGLWTRLDSHASGRRSGDQFCVYICDRFVIPGLSHQQQEQIGDGVLSLDALTRGYIHEHLGYRFVTVGSGNDAFALEREVQRGGLRAGKPFLNPL